VGIAHQAVAETMIMAERNIMKASEQQQNE